MDDWSLRDTESGSSASGTHYLTGEWPRECWAPGQSLCPVEPVDAENRSNSSFKRSPGGGTKSMFEVGAQKATMSNRPPVARPTTISYMLLCRYHIFSDLMPSCCFFMYIYIYFINFASSFSKYYDFVKKQTTHARNLWGFSRHPAYLACVEKWLSVGLAP